MALSWTDLVTKAQRLAKSADSDVLVQLKQDMNTGYHLFNDKLARYFTRKQQFTNLVAGQSIYQIPVDCIRVLGISTLVTATFEPPVKEIRSEEQWRSIKSVKSVSTNYPVYYFVLGNDEIDIWPTPSQSISNGLRIYYQPQDHDLSIDDTTSSSTSTTMTVTNGSTTVTNSGTILTTAMIGQSFQATGIPDLTWYEIVAVPSSSTLMLKSPYVAPSASGLSFRIGQLSIIPQAYQDAPMHYALGLFFSSQGNEVRSNYHLGQDEDGKRGMFWAMVKDCEQQYSSSNVSSVITDGDMPKLNAWLVPPPVGS